MSIVMGVDQHRAQITAEWIDLATGEISRARVLPADRAGVRRFLARRDFARRQVGCRALIDAYYGIGALTAVTIVAELGDCRRFANSRDAVRYSGLDITVYQSDRHRAPGTYRIRGRRRCAGRYTRPRRPPGGGASAAPTASTTFRSRSGSAATAPASRSRARCSSVATTPCASSAMTHSRHPPRRRNRAEIAQPHAARQAAALARPALLQRSTPPMLWPLDPGFGCALRRPVPAGPEPPTSFQPFARVKPSLTPMRRGRLPNDRCRHATRVDRLERSSGRNAFFPPRGITPSNISSPIRSQTGSWTKVSPGARAQSQHAHTRHPAGKRQPRTNPGDT